jgi:hypothetical protein
MTDMNSTIEDLAGTSEPCPDPAATGIRGSERLCCSLRLLSPQDPLTRLLMKADGVTEAYLDALIRKIAAKRE